MLELSIIVALDEENGIGKNNSLPWQIKADMKHFKNVTVDTTIGSAQNVVIMGRKTWESLPDKFRPLPNRLNVVLTRDKEFEVPENVLKFDSLSKALFELDSYGKSLKKVFVIGGAQIYLEAINNLNCETLYITHVLAEFDCDVFFPEFESRFQEVERSEVHEDNGIKFYFSEYSRK